MFRIDNYDNNMMISVIIIIIITIIMMMIIIIITIIDYLLESWMAKQHVFNKKTKRKQIVIIIINIYDIYSFVVHF